MLIVIIALISIILMFVLFYYELDSFASILMIINLILLIAIPAAFQSIHKENQKVLSEYSMVKSICDINSKNNSLLYFQYNQALEINAIILKNKKCQKIFG